MPVLKKLVVSDFRNIAFGEISFSPNLNCVLGGNGEGKTSLLDAIYYLSMTKSAFGTADAANYRYGTSSFTLAGTYLMPSRLETRVSIRVDEGGKRLVRDDKTLPRLGVHIGQFPVVTVSPADSSLVSDSGEERRRFVNMVLSQMRPDYLDGLQQYGRYLVQRNRLLKEERPDESLLTVLDERLSGLAAPLYEMRAAFCKAILPSVQDFYRQISGGEERLGIDYRSDLDRGPLAERLAARRERDLILGYTGAGLQRDDFLFTLDGHPIRVHGSQGQQKSFLVALKFAQYARMKEDAGVAPMLLLDDVFDKLDPGRVERLVGMVAGTDFGQIFITDSDKARIASLAASIGGEKRLLEAKNGTFTPIG